MAVDERDHEAVAHPDGDREEVRIEHDRHELLARGSARQVAEAHDPVHAGDDPGGGAGQPGDGAEAGPQHERRRQGEHGKRHDHEVVEVAAGEEDEVLRNVAAAAERREGKHGADRRHVEGEEGETPAALEAAADQRERREAHARRRQGTAPP